MLGATLIYIVAVKLVLTVITTAALVTDAVDGQAALLVIVTV